MSATMSFVVFNSPALGGESCKLEGFWRLVAFHAEDVTTKARVHIYGERPRGYMTMTCDGRFNAWVGTTVQTELVQSIWEDVARAFDGAVYYSGSYRLDGNKIIIRNDNVRYEGWTFYDASDWTWNEKKSASEDIRNFRLMPNKTGGDTLLIETAPVPNSNGVGKTIVGRVVWKRTLVAPAN